MKNSFTHQSLWFRYVFGLCITILIGVELNQILLLIQQIIKDPSTMGFHWGITFVIVMNGLVIWLIYQSFQINQEYTERRKNLSIRPILPTDEAFLWEMLDQSFDAPTNLVAAKFLRGNWAPPEINQYLKDWGREDYGLVAVDQRNRQPVGAAWFRLLTDDEKGYGYIDDLTPELVIAVSPNYQNMEIEMRLLIQLLEDAKKRFPSISLRVSPQKWGWRTYQLLGFKVVSKTRTSIVMQKDLNIEQSLLFK